MNIWDHFQKDIFTVFVCTGLTEPDPFSRGAAVVGSLGRKSQGGSEDNSQSRGVTTVVFTRPMESQKWQLNKHLDVRNDLPWIPTNHHPLCQSFNARRRSATGIRNEKQTSD